MRSTSTSRPCVGGTYKPGVSNVIGKVPCTRRATVERDGKWYCWQHDPVAVRKRYDDAYKRRFGDGS